MPTTSTEALSDLAKSFAKANGSRIPSDAQTGEGEACKHSFVLTAIGTDSQTAGSPLPDERASITAREPPAALFQPDALMVAQFFEDRGSKTRLEPEKKLMLAILEDAIDCFRDNHLARHGKKKQRFDKVQRWIFGVSGGWVFDFENICSVLELSPEYIRKGLVRWRERQLSKHRSASHGEEATKGPQLRFPSRRAG